MSRLRTIRLVAGFDLYDSLRSRKAIALLLLYVLVSLAATALFASLINRAWAEVNSRFGVEGSEQLLASEEMARELADLTKISTALARELLDLPPIALWYLFLATTVMPLVIVLTSSDAISSEVSSGSVRYALFRADRLGWAAGKLVGQTLLMVVGVLLGAVAAFILGAVLLDRFDAAASAWWLFRISGRASIYGFSYLGVALCASQLVRGNAAARGLGLLLVFVCWLGGNLLALAVARTGSGFFEVVRQVFPNAHDAWLFFPDFADRGPAMLALLAIGLAFFGVGYVRFARGDA